TFTSGCCSRRCSTRLRASSSSSVSLAGRGSLTGCHEEGLRGPRYGRGPTSVTKGGPGEMLYTAIDIHKSVFQAALLDPASGELTDARFPATREALHHWAMPLRGKVAAVAIEATTG